MARVRTNIGGFATSAAMAGAFQLAAQRHGLAHEMVLEWTPDAVAVAGLAAALCFALPFVAGHFILDRAGLTRRPYYALLGALSLAAGFLVTVPMARLQSLAEQGTLSLALLLPALLGAVIGFLYHIRAGWTTEADDPEALRALLADLPRSDEPAGEPGAAAPALAAPVRAPAFGRRGASEDFAHVSTGPSEYFEGPLQVRTSIASMAIAGAAAGALSGLLTMAGGVMARGTGWGLETLSGADINSTAGMVFGNAFFGAFLYPVPIYFGHRWAQNRGRTTLADYAKIGAAIPIVVGLLMFIVGVLATIWYVIPTAMAMALYRNLAGLEPRDLPEDIQVADRRTLIGADHARRRYGRVVGG